jgi:hypothetical protein
MIAQMGMLRRTSSGDSLVEVTQDDGGNGAGRRVQNFPEAGEEGAVLILWSPIFPAQSDVRMRPGDADADHVKWPKWSVCPRRHVSALRQKGMAERMPL